MNRKYLLPLTIFFIFTLLFFMWIFANIKVAEAQKASYVERLSKKLAWEQVDELKKQLDKNKMELAKASIEINKLNNQLDECQSK